MTADARIARIAESFAKREWKGDASTLAFELAREAPDAIADLVRAFFRVERGSPTFVHDVLARMPEGDWDALVGDAVAELQARPTNDLARDVLETAALQQPRALAPHLRTLFGIDDFYRAYGGIAVFRGAREEDVAWLAARLSDVNRARLPRAKFRVELRDTRFRAFSALLETRRPDAVALAIEAAPSLDLDASALRAWLWQIDLEQDRGALRSLTSASPLHLAFASGALRTWPAHFLSRELQGTWPTPPLGAVQHALGGRTAVRCGLCETEAHRLLTLDPVPDGLGVTGLARLELATCLSCLGAIAAPIWTEHETDGAARTVSGARAGNQGFPTTGIRETKVALVDLGSHWAQQSWGHSNGRENLFRVGGSPTFVQSAEYPRCDACDRTCTFLLQLDSELPAEDGGEWLWGSGGVGYVYWCDGCKRSACSYQCT
jgi:hypothetical protein